MALKSGTIGAGTNLVVAFSAIGEVVLFASSYATTLRLYAVPGVRLLTVMVVATPVAAAPVASTSSPFLTAKFTAPLLSEACAVTLTE